jgi:outer membrane protein assembly factor BamA
MEFHYEYFNYIQVITNFHSGVHYIIKSILKWFRIWEHLIILFGCFLTKRTNSLNGYNNLHGCFRGRNLVLVIIFWYSGFALSAQELFSSDSLLIGGIKIEGNFVTSKKVIYRELAFKLNEYVGRSDMEYLKQTSINNLNKTTLFNFVEINILEIQDGILAVTVKLTERWFIWPNVYLNHNDTNFSEWWRTKDLNKLEYGFGLKVNNFRGMKETVKFNYRFGNFTKYEFEYEGIHLDKKERHFLSLKASYASQKILPWVIESNKNISLKTGYKLLESTTFGINYKYRKAYFNSHLFGFGYSNSQIADTIRSLNPYFFGFNNQQLRYFNLRYEFVRDTRDSHFYPKTGYMIVTGINIKGLGILQHEYHSTDFYIQLFGYHKFINRLYGASGILFSVNSNSDKVFYEQTGLGFIQFVRGYEYYIVNGDKALLFKSLLKFELLPMKEINLKIWPIRKVYQLNRIPLQIYANVFFDAGYVTDKSGLYKLYNNTLVNKIMCSTGIGIDFVTYYDKILRLDYSFNALGERGLFIHWKAAIR